MVGQAARLSRPRSIDRELLIHGSRIVTARMHDAKCSGSGKPWWLGPVVLVNLVAIFFYLFVSAPLPMILCSLGELRKEEPISDLLFCSPPSSHEPSSEEWACCPFFHRAPLSTVSSRECSASEYESSSSNAPQHDFPIKTSSSTTFRNNDTELGQVATTDSWVNSAHRPSSCISATRNNGGNQPPSAVRPRY